MHFTWRYFRGILRADEEALLSQGDEDNREITEKSPREAVWFDSPHLKVRRVEPHRFSPTSSRSCGVKALDNTYSIIFGLFLARAQIRSVKTASALHAKTNSENFRGILRADEDNRESPKRACVRRCGSTLLTLIVSIQLLHKLGDGMKFAA